MTQTLARTNSAPQPRIARGGRSVELIGLACVLLTLTCAVGLTFWTWHTGQRMAADQRRTGMATLAEALASACEALIEEGQLSKLRVLVAETARVYELQEAALMLPDGGVLAHSDPRRITATDLPDPWPAGSAVPPAPLEPGAIQVLSARQVSLPGAPSGRAGFTLVLNAAPIPAVWMNVSAAGGLLGIAVVGVGLSLLLLQRARMILRPLRAIQDGLISLAEGERSPSALAISPRWGPEAAAWNAAMAERESLQAQLLDKRLQEPASGARHGDALLDRSCDVMPQGILVLDAAGNIRYANGAAGVLLGAKRSELPGKPLDAIVRDARVLTLVRQVVADGSRRRGAVEVEQPGGDDRSVVRYTCCRVAPDPDDGPAPAGGLLQIEDLTQQRAADRARESFVANATHELRTPLTNIRLYVETLLESADDDAALRGQCINVINQEARRLERMVSDMLSVAEIEAGSIRVHDGDVRLDALFEELRSDYQAPAAEKEITLTFDLPPKLPVLRGDRDKIAMTLHNLIGNALKYTPAGGVVTVTAEETAAVVAVHVADNGIGVSPEEAERIFEKFYRSKDKRVGRITGTGLGLALAREVARLHGGDITVQSQLDKGSTFTLTLPIGVAGAATPPPAAKAA